MNVNQDGEITTWETKKLNRLITVRLALCRRESKRSSKTITAKPRRDSIYVLDYLKEIVIARDFVEPFQFFFPPRKSHKKIYIKSFRDFVESNAGLRKTIRYMIIFLKASQNIEHDENIAYAEAILKCCEDTVNTTVRHGLSKSKTELPYCALCWRRIEDSKYYCHLHHPKQSSNEYYSGRAKLFSVMKSTDSIFVEELGRYNNDITDSPLPLLMYKWVSSLAEQPIKVKSKFPDIDSVAIHDWRKIANYIISFSEEFYPHTYVCIRESTTKQFASWRDWCLSIIALLDPIESAFWESNEIDDWLDLKSHIPAWLTLLALLQRHEAYEFIKSIPQPRGPKKGSIEGNKQLRQQISEIIGEMKAKEIKISQAEIGRQLGVDRRVINRHMKKMLIN